MNGMSISLPSMEHLHHAREVMIRSWSPIPQMPVFEHLGAVGPELMQRLLEEAELTSLQAGDPVALRKRLFSVLVEGMENIQKHSGELDPTPGVVLWDSPAGYTILMGNAMPMIMATIMEHRLELLNLMDPEELKEYYLKLLAYDGRTAGGGAGLGLLTIARKCTRPLFFRVMTVDEHTAYGILEIRVARQAPSQA